MAATGYRPPARKVLAELAACYPDARCALRFRNPFELLVATILSAQSTDRGVNAITPALFQRFPTPADMAAAEPAEVGEYIRSLGLHRGKARNLVAACRKIVTEHGGEVPRDREALMRLPGVGRKTANVVLSNAFGEPAIAVDTHVLRVSNRIGLADAPDDPLRTEQQLMRRIPRAQWSAAHHWLIHHGRQVCHARNPRCEACAVRPHCRYARALQRRGNGRRAGHAASVRRHGQ